MKTFPSSAQASIRNPYEFSGKFPQCRTRNSLQPCEGVIQPQDPKNCAGERQRAYKQGGHDDQIGSRKQGEAHENRAEPKHQNDQERNGNDAAGLSE